VKNEEREKGGQPELSTERLLLRPFAPEDAPTVRRLAGEWEIADKTLHIPHPYEEGMAEEWIQSHPAAFEKGEQACFAILSRESEGLVGAVSLEIRKTFRRGELGYWIGRPYWRRGYCTEAAHAVLRYGFADLGLHRICAFHFVRNPPSGRVMQKLGMVREGILRQHVAKWDGYEDVAVYGILQEEWMGR
jgi:ribosomal-protein-alanine N-acetyltransferase